jgi:hypothetical protein
MHHTTSTVGNLVARSLSVAHKLSEQQDTKTPPEHEPEQKRFYGHDVQFALQCLGSGTFVHEHPNKDRKAWPELAGVSPENCVP